MLQLEVGKSYISKNDTVAKIESELMGEFNDTEGNIYTFDGRLMYHHLEAHDLVEEIPDSIEPVKGGYKYEGILFKKLIDAQGVRNGYKVHEYPDTYNCCSSESVVKVPEYMFRKWHLDSFNEGYEIHYIDDNNFTQAIHLECGDSGHSEDLELLQYIIKLHNESIK